MAQATAAATRDFFTEDKIVLLRDDQTIHVRTQSTSDPANDYTQVDVTRVAIRALRNVRELMGQLSNDDARSRFSPHASSEEFSTYANLSPQQEAYLRLHARESVRVTFLKRDYHGSVNYVELTCDEALSNQLMQITHSLQS